MGVIELIRLTSWRANSFAKDGELDKLFSLVGMLAVPNKDEPSDRGEFHNVLEWLLRLV